MNSLSIVALRLFLILGPFLAQAAAGAPITLPAGLPLEVAAVHPVYADATHVSLQIPVPVLREGRVVIPAGTEVLGQVEVTRWRGRNGEPERGRLRVDHMIFPDHRMVAISGVVEDLPGIPSLHGGLAPHDVALPIIVGGLILSALTNNFAPFAVGVAGGTAGGIAVARTNRDGPVWLRTGSHFLMVLERPLALDPKLIE
jgi:hypothetical protein